MKIRGDEPFFVLKSPGADPGFQVRGGGGGAHIKKLHRAKGGANIFGVFRVKSPLESM